MFVKRLIGQQVKIKFPLSLRVTIRRITIHAGTFSEKEALSVLSIESCRGLRLIATKESDCHCRLSSLDSPVSDAVA